MTVLSSRKHSCTHAMARNTLFALLVGRGAEGFKAPLPRFDTKVAKLSRSRLSANRPSDVLCIGDMLYDCIATDEALGWPIEKVVEAGAWGAWPGGAPANVACALRKLGTPSTFAGCVGADPDGDALRTLLETTGVDTSLLRQTDEAPTRRVMVSRTLDGDRQFAGFADGKPASSFADAAFDYRAVRGDVPSVLGSAQWVCTSTLSLAFPRSADTLLTIVDAALSQGCRLCVDVNWRPVFWPLGDDEEPMGDDQSQGLGSKRKTERRGEAVARSEILRLAKRAHVVKLTDEEAEWLLDIPAADAFADPESVHEAFPNALAVLVTAGEKGAAFSLLGVQGIVPTFPVVAVETTGAGDAFTAGFLHGLLALELDFKMFRILVPKEQQRLVISSLMLFATACGAITCTRTGAIAAQPSVDEVEAFLVGEDVEGVVVDGAKRAEGIRFLDSHSEIATRAAAAVKAEAQLTLNGGGSSAFGSFPDRPEADERGDDNGPELSKAQETPPEPEYTFKF
mmetsp:Transcript_59526/g.112338  ORF Transcript_59526/g.112338 Transcript_59526/m.112338 type:complete len:511 (-) Transcript_59526:77-1609(-)